MDYVYYPCSGYDCSVVKISSEFVDNYIYVDSQFSEAKINDQLTKRGFVGYTPKYNDHVFADLRSKLPAFDKWGYELIRNRDKDKRHGPEIFRILFIKGDGIDLLKKIVEITSIAPWAVAYIQPGTCFGGNRDSYPTEFIQAIRSMQVSRLITDEYITIDLEKILEEYSDVIKEIVANTDMGEKAIQIRALSNA